jgi:hypothetical protein
MSEYLPEILEGIVRREQEWDGYHSEPQESE